jgi:hypothetical protein
MPAILSLHILAFTACTSYKENQECSTTQSYASVTTAESTFAKICSSRQKHHWAHIPYQTLRSVLWYICCCLSRTFQPIEAAYFLLFSAIFRLFYAIFVLFYIIFVLFYVLFVLCCSTYCLCVNVYCILLPPGVNPIAV